MDSSLADVLASVTHFVKGPTVATNVVAELHGAIVGLITTKGFEYTLFIARMPRGKTLDLHKQLPLPELVPVVRIRGVADRLDRTGEVVVPLDAAAMRAAVTDLVANHAVTEIAVCFFWSFLNPIHELRVREITDDLDLGVQPTLSAERIPVIREYERLVPAVLKSYVGPRTEPTLTPLPVERATRSLMPIY